MVAHGKPGTFRLERVLDHRRRLTEEAEQALARRVLERQQAEATLDALRDQRAGLYEAVGSVLDGEAQLDVTTLFTAEIRDLHLRRIAVQQEQAVMDAEVRAEAARQELLVRRVDQKALEKLRDKHAREQQARLRHAEAQLIDEVSTIQHAQRQRAVEGGKA